MSVRDLLLPAIVASLIGPTAVATSFSTANATEVQSVSSLEPTGEKLVILRSVVKLTPVYKGQLLVEMRSKAAAARRTRQEFDACANTMDRYECWRMYGDDLTKVAPQVPGGLERLDIDPLYVVLQYRVINIDLNGQKKLGEEALVACLNPRVPEGYWPVINRAKPILKYIPGGSADRRLPSEALKARACSAFVDFAAMGWSRR